MVTEKKLKTEKTLRKLTGVSVRIAILFIAMTKHLVKLFSVVTWKGGGIPMHYSFENQNDSSVFLYLFSALSLGLQKKDGPTKELASYK